MPTSDKLRRSPEELTRMGTEMLRRIEPKLKPEDAGKFVAIAVDDGAYDIDEDDHTAVSRLLARCPDADVWLGCVGQKATCKLRIVR